MRFKKSKVQQGIRTKSDYVPEKLPEASSIAQKAAALTFNQNNPSVSTAAAPSSKSSSNPVHKKEVGSSPSKAPTQKFSIHSYATNKTISINSNNKVTSESAPPHNLEILSPSPSLRKRYSTSSTRLPLRLNTSSQGQDPVLSPSPAAMAAANLVAKANPKSMMAVDSKLYEDPLTFSKPMSRSSSVVSRPVSPSSQLSHSPYSLVANVQSNNNNSGQFSPRNSHPSLQLYGSDNRSSRSLISSNELHKAIISPAPGLKSSLQTDVISEVRDESAHTGSGVTEDTFNDFKNAKDSQSQINSLVVDPLKNSSANSFLFNADNNNKSSNDLESPLTLKNGGHPYLAFFKTGDSPKNSSVPFFDGFNTSEKNLAVESDVSQDNNEYPKSKAKKQNEEFLYQSPLAAIKKMNVIDQSASTSDLNESSQLQPKRKPPPPIFDKESSLLLPPSLSQNTKRLSLNSDLDIDSSPQLSAISFNSSNEDLRQKKTRKPPPGLSPLDTPTNDLNSYFSIDANSLHPPENKNYDALNGSSSTIDYDDELSSLNDSTLLTDSTTTLPKYPTYTSTTSLHHHHPHLPMNKSTRKLKNNARAFFGRSKSSQQIPKEQVYYVGTSDHSNSNLNPATTSQTAILVPHHTVRLKTTMRKDKKGKEFNVDKPWKHHNDIDYISEQERKRYEGVWVANKDLCMNLAPKPIDNGEDATNAAKTAATQKLGNNTQLMHRIIVREIFKRSRLPSETLKKIYNLVDNNQDGFLRKDEFIVGMWLIDQCLYGRKLPKQVGDAIWDSVHNTGVVGVNITIGKKKKK